MVIYGQQMPSMAMLVNLGFGSWLWVLKLVNLGTVSEPGFWQMASLLLGCRTLYVFRLFMRFCLSKVYVSFPAIVFP